MTNPRGVQVVMACDLVATMLFVFCHVVSTVRLKTVHKNGTSETVAEIADAEDKNSRKLIPEPWVDFFPAMH